MGDPIARRQRGVRDLHAVAVDPPAARTDQERAGLAEEPHPEPAALERDPGPRSARATMSSRSPRNRSPRARASPESPRRGRNDLRSTRRVQLGNRPRVDQQHERHRRQDRRQQGQRDGTADERHHVGDGRRRPHAPRPLEPLIARPRTPVDARQLRKYLRARGYPPAIGLRRITSEASAGSSRTCSACPSPLDTTA